MQELVWRKGDERCERSYRENVATVATVTTVATVATVATISTEKKALAEQKIYEEPEKTNNMMIDFRDAQSGGVAFGAAPPNKRETANAKMNERYLIGQATQNPFMPNNNYVNDIEVQMNFLTPSKG